MSDRLFLDTNVFIASLTDEPNKGATASTVLNLENPLSTSLLNLMELRTVLTKKKRIEQSVANETIREITEDVEIVLHESSDVAAANDLQQETLLYPMDCLILALAEDQDATLVTFDSELIEAGAVAPEQAINR